MTDVNKKLNENDENYPLISIVIPTHNRKEKVIRLIKSILNSNYPKNKLEIIVVDDASTDDTHNYVRKLFPQVKVIRNAKEKLVSESRNIGIKTSRGKYVFLIDDDNVIDKNAIKELVEYMEKHPEVGIVAPIMYFLKDPKRIWCAGVKRNYWTTITKYIGFNTIDSNIFKEPYETEDIPNAFMVRREVFRNIGLFNSKLFPIHYEEADFCQRARRAGYKIMIVPSAKIWHDVPLPEEKKSRLENPIRTYYFSRNRILYHRLYSRNFVQKIIALIFAISIILLYHLPRVMSLCVRDRRLILVKMLKGLIDGLRISLNHIT